VLIRHTVIIGKSDNARTVKAHEVGIRLLLLRRERPYHRG
jgi:hypothetical protein